MTIGTDVIRGLTVQHRRWSQIMKHIQINYRQNQKENATAVKRGRIWINYHGKCNQVTKLILKTGYSRFCASVLLITNVDYIVQILHFNKNFELKSWFIFH